jgi:hypothetical protein
MAQDSNTPWQYKPDADAPKADKNDTGSSHRQAKPQPRQSATWEAPEFIDHPHGAGWYVALVFATLVMAALTYLLAKDAVATVFIVLVGIIVGIFATQKPNVVKYEISASGLSINGKLYNLSNYKSFTVIQEGALTSANLFPLKRFMPPLSVYFDPKEEKKIIDTLGNYLPYEQQDLDAIDRTLQG